MQYLRLFNSFIDATNAFVSNTYCIRLLYYYYYFFFFFCLCPGYAYVYAYMYLHIFYTLLLIIGYYCII